MNCGTLPSLPEMSRQQLLKNTHVKNKKRHDKLIMHIIRGNVIREKSLKKKHCFKGNIIAFNNVIGLGCEKKIQLVAIYIYTFH